MGEGAPALQATPFSRMTGAEGGTLKSICAIAGSCSGCTAFGLPYAKQLRDKEKSLREVLMPALGGAAGDRKVSPLVASPSPLGYRTSTKVCLGEDAFGRRRVGLYARGSKSIVPMPSCPVHDPRLDGLLHRIFGVGATLPFACYDHQRRGFQSERLKFATLRINPGASARPPRGVARGGLVLSHTGIDRELLRSWATRVAAAEALAIYATELTRGDDDQVLSGQAIHLAGPETFPYEVAGEEFMISPMAFFQANGSLLAGFVQAVAEGVADPLPTGGGLLDLYGGFGAYSLRLAGQFDRIWVVDANPAATAAAAEAVQRRGLRQVQVITATVEDFGNRLLKGPEAAQVSHALVNPPRSGLSAGAVRLLCDARLPELGRLTYVSCHPESLSRDLRALSTGERAYRIESLQAFDMFPQTGHVEVVARLVRRASRSRSR